MLKIAQAIDIVLRLETHNARAMDNLLNPSILEINLPLLKAKHRGSFQPPVLETIQIGSACTDAASSATCERSFSATRRVRNYLRTTMTEERFSTRQHMLASDMLSPVRPSVRPSVRHTGSSVKNGRSQDYEIFTINGSSIRLDFAEKVSSRNSNGYSVPSERQTRGKQAIS